MRHRLHRFAFWCPHEPAENNETIVFYTSDRSRPQNETRLRQNRRTSLVDNLCVQSEPCVSGEASKSQDEMEQRAKTRRADGEGDVKMRAEGEVGRGNGERLVHMPTRTTSEIAWEKKRAKHWRAHASLPILMLTWALRSSKTCPSRTMLMK